MRGSSCGGGFPGRNRLIRANSNTSSRIIINRRNIFSKFRVGPPSTDSVNRRIQEMNLHEYQAKILFSEFGIPVPEGKPAHSVKDALGAATEIGGRSWVVKARCTPEDAVRQAE